MTAWVRFLQQGKTGFGILEDDTIQVHEGDLFNQPAATGQSLARQEVTLLTPCEPTKMLALWNNFKQRAKKEGLSKPEHPLYFVKANSCFVRSIFFTSLVSAAGMAGYPMGPGIQIIDESLPRCLRLANSPM